MAEELKNKVVEGVEQLFIQYGIRSVSMDDIARKLVMSKKTLYQYFKNKDELVTEVVSWSIGKERKTLTDLISRAENAINELILISQCIRQTLKVINASLLYDLKKYHPDGWSIFLNYKYEFIKGTMKNNIVRGKKEELYRSNIDEELLSTLRVETVQLIFDGAFAGTNQSFVDIQVNLLDHFICGLLSEKGHKQYTNIY